MPFTPPKPPSDLDPQGFAVGLLANEELKKRGIRLKQFRWEYGALADREAPFDDHHDLDGRFMGLDGVLQGYFPGDHKGCLCSVEPVYVRERKPGVTGPVSEQQ